MLKKSATVIIQQLCSTMSIPIPRRQLFIDGEWREPVNRKRLSVTNPATEEIIGMFP